MTQNEVFSPVRKNNWVNIFFFSTTGLLGLIGAPLYLYHFGISVSEMILFVFYLVVAPLSITSGYHRLFSHVTYKANAFVRFLFLFFGAAAYEQSALKWASQHRDHHRFVDTERDPYNIKKGFFYAHIGWILFWGFPIHYENVKDLKRSRLISHQHRYYPAWSFTSGILLPLLIGTLTGHFMGAFFLSVCLRLALIHHATFCINSVCHTFGKATFDIYSSARDHWTTALITYGEGYHNFHHHFPADFRNGIRWYQWDPTKWTIVILAKLGLAWNLKRISKFQIMGARLQAEHQRVEDWLLTLEHHPHLALIHKAFQVQYTRLAQTLGDWERAARERQRLVTEGLQKRSDELKNTLIQMQEARNQFREMFERWKSFRGRIFATA